MRKINPTLRMGLSLFRLMVAVLFGIIIFLSVVTYFYFRDNPPDKASSTLKPPYFLSAKPDVLNLGGSTELLILSLKPLPTNSIQVQVISPDGTNFNSNCSSGQP